MPRTPAPALPDNPHGWPVLRERRADGTEIVHVIDSFPFEIGREPEADAAIVLDDELDFVSRTHLRIESLHGRDCLNVINQAYNRRGTWRNGRPMDDTFLWVPVRPQQDGNRQKNRSHQGSSDDGWVTLGDRTLSARAVQFRLEAAQAGGAGPAARAASTCMAAMPARTHEGAAT